MISPLLWVAQNLGKRSLNLKIKCHKAKKNNVNILNTQTGQIWGHFNPNIKIMKRKGSYFYNPKRNTSGLQENMKSNISLSHSLFFWHAYMLTHNIHTLVVGMLGINLDYEVRFVVCNWTMIHMTNKTELSVLFMKWIFKWS